MNNHLNVKYISIVKSLDKDDFWADDNFGVVKNISPLFSPQIPPSLTPPFAGVFLRFAELAVPLGGGGGRLGGSKVEGSVSRQPLSSTVLRPCVLSQRGGGGIGIANIPQCFCSILSLFNLHC